MRYTALNNESTHNAMRLQSIGIVLGTPAKEVKKGDFLMWNFGAVEEIKEIIKETEKTIIFSIMYENKMYERKLNKTRLVCKLQ